VALLPGAAIALLAFHTGGYLPEAGAATAVLALAVAAALAAVGAAYAPRRGALLAPAALLGLIGLVVLSGSWSDAGWRGLLDASRLLAYAATLVAFLLLGRSSGRARTLLLGLAAAALVIDAVALVAWLAPDVLRPPSAERVRLSAPTTYWNATGLLAGLGTMWCLAVSAADRSPVVRAVAAAGIPLGTATIYLTASRGAAAATAVGVLVVLAAGPTRRVALALLPGAAGAVLALMAVRGPDGLDVATPTGAALHGGHRALLLLALITLVAVGLRAATAPLDRRLAAWRPSPRAATAGWAIAAALVAGAATVAVAAGGATRIGDAVRDATSTAGVSSDLAPGERFQELSTNGRSDLWSVALHDGLRAEPLHGTGAGTFRALWAHHGTTHFDAVDAHSLYVETLGELGLSGALLVAAVLLALLVALARRTCEARRDRTADAAWAGLAAGAVAWAVHAGYDFDWELPALTLPLFATGGLALARRASVGGEPSRRLSRPARAAIVAVAAALSVLPILVGGSQRHVDAALAAHRAGDCATARDEAGAARTWLGSRPEPYLVDAWCAAEQSQAAPALAAGAAAIDRDERDWTLRLSDAIVRARLGRDPRHAFAAALRRSPESLTLKHARAALGREHDPAGWRRLGAAVAFPEPRLAGQQLPTTTE
jgi:hypothetical protein